MTAKLRIHAGRPYILLLLGMCGLASLPIAFALRFDFQIPARHTVELAWALGMAALIKPSTYFLFRLHRGWWSAATLADLWSMLRGTLLAQLLWSAAVLLRFASSFPRTIYILDLMVGFGLIAACRLGMRSAREMSLRHAAGPPGKVALIYGAGRSGLALARELHTNPKLGYRVAGFLDDNQQKHGEVVAGLPILGDGNELAAISRRIARKGSAVHEVLIAMPSATGKEMRRATSYCRAAGMPCRTLPSQADLLQNRVLSAQIRDIRLEDLLSREPVHLEIERIRETIRQRVVLVTGAAGSIGSELCRQIVSHEPSHLIMLDHAESDLFRIHMELIQNFPNARLTPRLGDVRNASMVRRLFDERPINVVFHAAAYKHVPLAEDNCVETSSTNILGTWNVAQAAALAGTSRFVLISSDKAVNPTNVMGATKRAAELIVSATLEPGRKKSTEFVSVRFGNVLGSNGSVVPIFKEQIAAGGPVTVTHPEVRRFFMTIREAVQLVLQASTMGKGAEIFVLEMGEMVRIVDLARNMIRLSGLVPDEDVEIRYVGLRPGEKLFEEISNANERLQPTSHEKIKAFQSTSLSHEAIGRWLQSFEADVRTRDDQAVIAHLKDLVPEYEPSGHYQPMALHAKVAVGFASPFRG